MFVLHPKLLRRRYFKVNILQQTQITETLHAAYTARRHQYVFIFLAAKTAIGIQAKVPITLQCLSRIAVIR